jgi:adenylate cyclase, class 2
MLEIEIKYRVADFGPIEERLQESQARPAQDRHDADAYYNAPHRDFAKTDESLRIRRIGLQSFITYKGPRIDKTTKTRTEIEIPLASDAEAADGCERIFRALGFQPVAVVRKHRRVFELAREGFEIEICLDEVDHVGRYVEIEIVADEAVLDAARAVLLNCARDLGLAEAERRSYLELLLANSPK